MFKIGTLADWFGAGLIDGIRQSEKCGAQGVQIYAWNELDPAKAGKDYIRQIKQTAKDCRQEIVALCGELGGHGLERKTENAPKVAYLKKTVDLAGEFDCSIVTTHIGVIPDNPADEKYKVMQEACSEAGLYARRQGVTIAVETGPEPVKRLKGFVESCDGSLAINYDPANLVMVVQDDEVQGVYDAGSAIVHTHAKDGRSFKAIDPIKVYDIFADGGIEALSSLKDYFLEYPLGEGAVRWAEYLKALDDIGYHGFLTIEREVGENAAADIQMAVDFLQRQLA